MITYTEISEAFWSLLRPWQFMFISLLYLPGTIWGLLIAREIRSVLLWHRLQHAWFSTFWAWAGPRIRESNGPRITALLDGRVTKGAIVDEFVTLPVSGIVLDIGPGAGYWVNLYAETKSLKGSPGSMSDGGSSKITKIYGVEPNPGLHASLSKRIGEAGLEDLYEILPVGIQSLSHAIVKDTHYKTRTIEKGSVDCIVSLLCLCSIPDPEANIIELYSYLKKGGRWYVFEHVRVGKFWPVRLYQGIFYICLVLTRYGG
jgi:SAM-dependent methyltransferase